MYKKIQIFLEQHHMIEKGDRVIVGLSGGADSVCLLLLLAGLREKMGFSLAAVHVEHGIRGEESRQDAKFSGHLCKQYDIPFWLYVVDAPAHAKKMHQSLEEAARVLRYECFRKAVTEYCADKVAVAHHANDNAETMLFHLARGTGIRGLCGIAPVTKYDPVDPDGDRVTESYTVIRPLLCVSRDEIEDWLAGQRQDYCTDSTNTDLLYSRNRIRSQILPELLQINSGAVEHMQRTADSLAQISAFLDETAMERGRDCFSILGGEAESKQIRIDCKKFLALPSVLQKNLIHQLIGEAAGQRKDITSVHVEQVLQLFSFATGKRIRLPYQIQAQKSYEHVFLEQKEPESGSRKLSAGQTVPKEPVPKTIDLQIPGETAWEKDISIHAELIDFDGNFLQIPKNRYTKWFDYDKMKFTIRLRYRQSGDMLSIDSNGGRKKLKDWFIDEKIPRGERDSIPLLADGNRVIWVIGYRISEAYKVTQETKRVLAVTFQCGSHPSTEMELNGMLKRRMEEDIR